jgi:Vacuole effluxer Atg22 like.
VLGPLVFGLTLQFAGSYRLALLFLVFFFIIGGVLLSRVNVQEGMAQVSQTRADDTVA